MLLRGPSPAVELKVSRVACKSSGSAPAPAEGHPNCNPRREQPYSTATPSEDRADFAMLIKVYRSPQE